MRRVFTLARDAWRRRLRNRRLRKDDPFLYK